MLRNYQPIYLHEIEPLIHSLQGILCLHHWKVKHQVRSDASMKDSLMMIQPNRDRQIATIYIRQSLVGQPICEVGPLILHELLHLVLEPIVEEHQLQLQYEVSEERLKEYQKRFRRPLEKVVEQLTNQISPMIIVQAEITDEIKLTKEELIQQLREIKADHELLRKTHAENTRTLHTILDYIKQENTVD